MGDLTDMQAYRVDIDHGFLPEEDPLIRFQDAAQFEGYAAEVQDYLETVDDLAHNIPGLLEENRLRFRLQQLQHPPADYVPDTEREQFHLYQAASFLASAYVHKTGDAKQVDHVPSSVAIPLYESAQMLDVPPILSYDAYSLHNWYRIDPDSPIELGNIDTIFNFVELEEGPTNDESWFMLVHVEIEEEAGPGLAAIPDAFQAVAEDKPGVLYAALSTMDASLKEMGETMQRMPEHNAPEEYAVGHDGEGYRPYIDGFEGITFNGVPQLDGPQHLRGETGAQSTIFPAYDRAFNVQHDTNELEAHIEEMVDYMPAPHRDWLAAVAEAAPDIRSYIQDVGNEELIQVHDSILRHMVSFRFMHWQYAKTYIEDPTGDTTGTGGTEFIQFLPDLIDKTEERLIGDAFDQHWEYLAHTFDEVPSF